MFRDQVKIPFERKMTQFALSGMMILLLVSCGKSKKPEDVLTEKEMVNVMTELYLAEEKLNRLAIPYDSINKIFPMFSDKVFEDTGVTDSVFRKSFDYYMSEPEKLEKIYTILVDSLNLKAQRASVHKKKDAAVE